MAKDRPGQKKLYRGAYDYINNDIPYAEEVFDVYKDLKESSLHYESQFSGRTSTGEILLIKTILVTNKDYAPLKLSINRSLGKESVDEFFTFNNKTSILSYRFECNGELFTSENSTTPKFHISTPTAVTSVLFTVARRTNMNSKTTQNIIASTNNWEYKGPPITKIISFERLTLTSSQIKIKGKNMEATEYAIYPSEGNADEDNKQDIIGKIKVFVSKHDGIPYRIEENRNKKIEIKYLNNLSEA